MRDTIRFLKGGEIIELENVGPTETLLDYLRLRRRETGTKEGCGEGDCGACTVALGRLVDGKLIYQPVNSCILLLGMVDGAELVTVEDLEQDDRLHPVQTAMSLSAPITIVVAVVLAVVLAKTLKGFEIRVMMVSRVRKRR